MIKDIIIHIVGRSRKEPFGHTSYLSRSRGGVCRNAMVVHSQLARVP